MSYVFKIFILLPCNILYQLSSVFLLFLKLFFIINVVKIIIPSDSALNGVVVVVVVVDVVLTVNSLNGA